MPPWPLPAPSATPEPDLFEPAEQACHLGLKTERAVDDARLALTEVRGGLSRARYASDILKAWKRMPEEIMSAP